MCAVYHFHGILPDALLRLPSADEANMLLSTNEGIASALMGASELALGTFGPRTIPPMPFRPVEIKTLNWAREYGVGSFNNFRAMLGLPRYHDWAWAAPEVVDDLKELYKDPEAVELKPGRGQTTMLAFIGKLRYTSAAIAKVSQHVGNEGVRELPLQLNANAMPWFFTSIT